MAGTLVEYLTTDTQMKLYRGTVLTIMEKCGEELKFDPQVQKIYYAPTHSSMHKAMIVPKHYGTLNVIFFMTVRGSSSTRIDLLDHDIAII